MNEWAQLQAAYELADVADRHLCGVAMHHDLQAALARFWRQIPDGPPNRTVEQVLNQAPD